MAKKACPLLDKLPPELRLHIYEFVFDTNYCSRIEIDPDNTCWTPVEEKESARHIRALLVTCRTLYREAAPIVHDATLVNVVLHDDIPKKINRRRSKYHYLGTLEACATMKALKHIGLFSVVRQDSSCVELARRLQLVLAAMPSNRTLKIDNILLALGKTFNKEADPIILALAALDIQPGATLILHPGVVEGWHKDSASEDLFNSFLEKCRFRYVEPADWRTREAKKPDEQRGARSPRRFICGSRLGASIGGMEG